MDMQHDVDQLAVQTERLQFDHFDADTAWELGCKLRATAIERGFALAIEVQHHGWPLFYSALPGTTPDNAEWLRRKRNVALRFHKSSYAVGLVQEMKKTSLSERQGLPVADYAAVGGSVPIRVRGVGVIGTVGVSGLPAREDHNFVISVLADMLGVPLSEVALSAE